MKAGAEHHFSSRHGGWTLGAGSSEVDRRIRARLALGEAPAAIAEACGVATGYVLALAGLDERAPRPPRPELPPAEPVERRPRVQCLVTGDELAARDCVERQVGQRCFCPRAAGAIAAVAETAAEGSRLADQLDQCRAVARDVLRRPAEERYRGPARAAREGRPAEEEPLIAGELPAPPKTIAGSAAGGGVAAGTPAVIEAQVEPAARRHTQGPLGVCVDDSRPHAEVTTRPVHCIGWRPQDQPPAPNEESEPEFSQPEPERKPLADPEPSPAEAAAPQEETMPEVEEKTCPTEGCGRKLRSDNRSGRCHHCAAGSTRHLRGAPPEPRPGERLCSRAGCAEPLRSDNVTGFCRAHGSAERAKAWREARKGESAPAAPKPDAPMNVTRVPPAPDEVLDILRARAEHHEREARRCRAALAALEAA